MFQCEGVANMTIVISEDVSLLYIKVRRTNIADSEWYYCGIPVPGGNWKNLSKHVAMAALRERWIGDPSLVLSRRGHQPATLKVAKHDRTRRPAVGTGSRPV